jgi:hypothetical protein
MPTCCHPPSPLRPHSRIPLCGAPSACQVLLKAHVENICFEYFRNVSYGYYINKSRCFICCNGYTRMLQASVPNVSSVSSDVCCKYVYLDVTYVSYVCCECFIPMLHMFHTYVASVSSRCCICFCNGYTRVFLVFQMYVASVSTISDVCYKCFI